MYDAYTYTYQTQIHACMYIFSDLNICSFLALTAITCHDLVGGFNLPLINMEKAPNAPNHQAAQHNLIGLLLTRSLIGALTCFSINFPLFLDNRTHSITHFGSQG